VELSNDNGASYYIMTKNGKKRASADVGLMFIAYNLRRIKNILESYILKKFFQELAFFYWEYLPLQKHLASLRQMQFFGWISLFFNIASLISF